MKRKILMSVVLFCTILLIFAIPQCFADETIVEFKDENLKEALVKYYDTNQDGEMSVDEMESITNIGMIGGYEQPKNVSKIDDLKYCINLQKLNLSNNNVEDISVLSNLTKLETLNLSGNNVKDISSLNNLTNLNSLDLSNNNIMDISALSNLINLKFLDISRNNIEDISALSNLTNLTILYLWENSIIDISPLSNLKEFSSLELSSNNIKDISSLTGFEHVTSLNISGNKLEELTELDSFPNLTKLDISNNQNLKTIKLENIINLTYLDIGSNTSLKSLKLENLENLSKIIFIGTYLETLELKDLKNLETLPYIKYDNMKTIKLENLEKLESLGDVLSYRSLIANEKLEEVILYNLPKFTSFSLNGKINLKNVTIQNMNSLQTISITDCTVESLTLDTLPILTTLNCKANRISSLENLNNLPELQSVNFIANNISDISPLTRFPKLAVADMRENPINQEDSGTQATIYQLMEYGPFNLLLSEYTPVLTTVENEDVIVNDETVAVMPVEKGTNISEFLNEENFPVINTYTITVYDASGNEKSETEKIGSKNVIKITNSAGDTIAEYMVIVPGDVTGNGEVKMYDSFVILKGTLFSGSLDAIETLIRDYNKDGSVKMYDAFAFLKQALFN